MANQTITTLFHVEYLTEQDVLSEGVWGKQEQWVQSGPKFLKEEDAEHWQQLNVCGISRVAMVTWRDGVPSKILEQAI